MTSSISEKTPAERRSHRKQVNAQQSLIKTATSNSTSGATPFSRTQTNFETVEDIFLTLTDLLRPPERISISDAAERYVRLNNPGSYIGPYRNDMAPYMVEPMNTLQSKFFTSLAFVGPAQSGKTEALIL